MKATFELMVFDVLAKQFIVCIKGELHCSWSPSHLRCWHSYIRYFAVSLVAARQKTTPPLWLDTGGAIVFSNLAFLNVVMPAIHKIFTSQI